MNANELRKIAEDKSLIEIGRQAVENALVDYRKSRISMMRGNGLVIREKDGTDSPVIRFGPETAIQIALLAIADHLEGKS